MVTHLSQVKVDGEAFPLWQLTFNDNPYILYSDDTYCSLGSMTTWRGRWNDVTIYAHYWEGGEDLYFQLYRNDALLCERRSPLNLALKAVLDRQQEMVDRQKAAK